MQLGHLRLDWQSLGIAVGACVAAVIALDLLRRVMGWLLGPIFVYETTRLARKGYTFWLRCAIAVSTLGLLAMVAPSSSDMNYNRHIHGWTATPAIPAIGIISAPRPSREPDEDELEEAAALHRAAVMTRFAMEFSNTFLLIVAIVAMLVTPLYLAGAISEEKERRSIDFLLATHLTNYEIVVGKLTARMLNMFGLLLATLPILAITQVWGGVDLAQLLHGLLVIAIAIASYASLSVGCSVIFDRTRHAALAAYAILL